MHCAANRICAGLGKCATLIYEQIYMRVFACAHYPARIAYWIVSIMHGYRILLMHCDTRILRNKLRMRAELRLRAANGARVTYVF